MSAKSVEEWSEEERKVALEYEKKCKDLEDEREKYRKVNEQWLRGENISFRAATRQPPLLLLQ